MSDITSTIALILLILLCLVVAAIVNKVFISKTECPERCPAGPIGPIGPDGQRGPVGSSGKDGIDGKDGQRGLVGPTGDSGPIGPRGNQGSVGEQGIQGIAGPKGLQGIQGEQGPKGIQGIQGDQGPKGDQGPRGDTGLQGAVGSQGPAGKDGSINITDSSGNALGSYYDKITIDNMIKPLANQSVIDTLYAKKEDVQKTYAKTSDYTTTNILERDYLKKSAFDLSPYAKTDVLSTYALRTSLPDLTPYAKTVDLSPYAKTDVMNTALGLKANLDSPTFTGTVGGITKAMLGLGNVEDVSATEIKNYALNEATKVNNTLANFSSRIYKDIDLILTPFAKTTDLSPYALRTSLPDLTPYAKTDATTAALALKAPLANPVFTGNVTIPTGSNIFGYAKTSDLTPYAKTDATTAALGLKAPIESPTFTGMVIIPTGSNIIGYAKTSDLTPYAPLANPTFTGTVGGITKAMLDLGYVNNTSDDNKPISTAQLTALGLKANLASPTFTGTVGGITNAMIGLGNVDNTSDLLKPISTAQLTALGLKAPLASPTFTGKVMLPTGTNTCIGNTCIDENQLKQLVRGDINVDLNPLDYYEMTGTTLLLEHYQDVKPLGWSLVKTIVPGNKVMRIVQQAYKSAWTGNASLDSDVSKMYTRYSLSDKIGIEKDSTKNGWTEWSTERFVGDWTLTTKLDGNLRFYNGGQNKLLVQTDGKLWKSDKAAYI